MDDKDLLKWGRTKFPLSSTRPQNIRMKTQTNIGTTEWEEGRGERRLKR